MFIVNITSPDLTWRSWFYWTVSLEITSQLTLPVSSSQFLLVFMLLNRLLHVQYFVDHCLSFCPFSFVNGIVCRFTTSNYLFGYLQTFLHFWNVFHDSNPRFFSIENGSRIETTASFLVFLEIISLWKTAEPQVQTPECRYLADTCF